LGYACGPDGGIVRLFDVSSGRERATLEHAWTARSVAFSPDGKLLASGGGGTVRLWELATDKARTLFKVEPDRDVSCVAFAPDGRTLAVGVGRRFGPTETEVRLWDLNQDRVRAILKGELGTVRALGFAPQGNRPVTVSSQLPVLWDLGHEVIGNRP
jgi:hypothetical protein